MSDQHRQERIEGVEADLDRIFGQLERLRALQADPEAAEDGDRRYDFSIRWGVLLSGRLQRLNYYDVRGELGDSAQRRFDALRSELREMAPVAVRLGMADPTEAMGSREPER